MAWQAKSTPVVSKDVVYVHSWMASLSELGHKEVKASWEETLAAYDKNRDGKIAKDEYPDESLAKIWFLYDLDKDGFLNGADWKYLLARNNTKNGLYAVKLGGRGDVRKSHVLGGSRRECRTFRLLSSIRMCCSCCAKEESSPP